MHVLKFRTRLLTHNYRFNEENINHTENKHNNNQIQHYLSHLLRLWLINISFSNFYKN